jgi:hypothetical protein
MRVDSDPGFVECLIEGCRPRASNTVCHETRGAPKKSRTCGQAGGILIGSRNDSLKETLGATAQRYWALARAWQFG